MEQNEDGLQPEVLPSLRHTQVEPKKGWIASNPHKFKKFTKTQQGFLIKYMSDGRISKSCESIGLTSTNMFYKWVNTDKDFSEAFESCKKHLTDVLEDSAITRAVYGVDRCEYYKDQVIGVRTEYSDSILALLLKANDPQKYNNRHILQGTGPGGAILTADLFDDLLKD